MRKQFLDLVNACGEDAFLSDCGDFDYILTFDDFVGFDEDWKEIYRHYTNPKQVEFLNEWLVDNCKEEDYNLYKYFTFDDFKVTVSFTSYDI